MASVSSLAAALMVVALASASCMHRGPGGPHADDIGTTSTGPGYGPQGKRGPMGRWGDDYTPGWSMMSESERAEHRERMRGFTTYEDCRAYMAKQHERMAARATERGGNPPPQPRHDACAGLQR